MGWILYYSRARVKIQKTKQKKKQTNKILILLNRKNVLNIPYLMTIAVMLKFGAVFFHAVCFIFFYYLNFHLFISFLG